MVLLKYDAFEPRNGENWKATYWKKTLTKIIALLGELRPRI